jgi:hypothetical protein
MVAIQIVQVGTQGSGDLILWRTLHFSLLQMLKKQIYVEMLYTLMGWYTKLSNNFLEISIGAATVFFLTWLQRTETLYATPTF